MEAVVHTAAGVFGAAAASISLMDKTTSELVYQTAWGAGAREIVGVRLPPGAGIAGQVVESASPNCSDCRTDPRFAAGSRRAPATSLTMLIVPLLRGCSIGALSILDNASAAVPPGGHRAHGVVCGSRGQGARRQPGLVTSLGMTRFD